MSLQNIGQYGPFSMKKHTGSATESCNLVVRAVGRPLSNGNEFYEENGVTDDWDRVLNFETDGSRYGQLIHITLTDILCASPGMNFEWPKDDIIVSAVRFTDSMAVATEMRSVRNGTSHTLASFYIRGDERIVISCNFQSDNLPDHTIVVLRFREGLRGDGGGSASAGGGGGRGEGGSASDGGGSGGGGCGSARGGGGEGGSASGGGGKSSGSRRKRSDGLGYLHGTLAGSVGPNSSYAKPDAREMNDILSAQAASRQEQTKPDITRQECPVCKEQEERRLCCICNDRKIRVIFRPCNHLVCFLVCTQDSNLNKCPICRTPIQDRAVVYGYE